MKRSNFRHIACLFISPITLKRSYYPCRLVWSSPLLKVYSAIVTDNFCFLILFKLIGFCMIRVFTERHFWTDCHFLYSSVLQGPKGVGSSVSHHQRTQEPKNPMGLNSALFLCAFISKTLANKCTIPCPSLN